MIRASAWETTTPRETDRAEQREFPRGRFRAGDSPRVARPRVDRSAIDISASSTVQLGRFSYGGEAEEIRRRRRGSRVRANNERKIDRSPRLRIRLSLSRHTYHRSSLFSLLLYSRRKVSSRICIGVVYRCADAEVSGGGGSGEGAEA